MDCARLVDIVARDLGIFDDLDDGGFARLLVVFNRLSDAEIQAAARDCLLQLGEKFVLEDAVEQWIGFLG